MNLIGTMAARNESWVIGTSLRIALKWCDSVVVLCHCCTDSTVDVVTDIAEEHPGRVHLLVEKDPAWAEMKHRQRMLETARSLGATHIAITDADEILTANVLPQIRQQVEQIPVGGCLDVGMPCMWRSLDQYRVGASIWANRFDLTLAFADAPYLHWSDLNGYEHHHRRPHGSTTTRRGYGMNGGVMHLQFANWRRLVAKHRGYKMNERLKYPEKPIYEIDRMYSLALDEAGLTLSAAPAEWWAGYEDLRRHVDLDAEPWHERECARLMAEHGPQRFAGLNLFGMGQVAA